MFTTNSEILERMKLLDLPDDMFFEIGKRLKDPRDLSALTHSCSFFRSSGMFHEEIDLALSRALLLKRLIVAGQERDALKMIEAMPYLLFIKAQEVEDLSQDWYGNVRIIAPGSAFQTLLGMGYTNILSKQPVKSAIEANIEIATRQFDQQFPKGVDYPLVTYDFDNLVKAVKNDAFDNDQPNSQTLDETEKFINFFKHSVTGTGFYFDMRIIEDVARVESECFARFGWGLWQRNAFWYTRIYGYLQTLVTTFDANIICKGEYFNSHPESLGRIGDFSREYYPTRPGQQTGIGADSFIGVDGYSMRFEGGMLTGYEGGRHHMVKELCQQRMATFTELEASLHERNFAPAI